MEQGNASEEASKPKPNNELRLRVIYSFIMMAGGMFAAIMGGISWGIASAFVMAVMANEWAGMAKTDKKMQILVTIIAAICGFGFVIGPEAVQVGSCVLYLTALAIAAIKGGSIGIIGAAYLALSGFAFASLRADPNNGLLYIFGLFAVVWATDSSAYAFGRWLKGPKLMPVISPNKTWSGFVGGTFAGTAAGALYSVLANITINISNHTELTSESVFKTIAIWTFIGITLSLASQIGDLLESLVKRFFGVKDTSTLIPGHGGLLDRLDGHLGAALTFAILLVIPGFAEGLT